MDEKKWKRKLPCRIYDYNYKVGESYYNPQTNYIQSRDIERQKVIPPECASYAERFASRPFYGTARGLPYNEQEASLNQPLVRRRSTSATRGDSRDRGYGDRGYGDRGHGDTPSSRRYGLDPDRSRGRDRTPRDMREQEPEPPRRRFSLADDLDFKIPVSKYVDSDFGFRSSLDRDSLVPEDSLGFTPAMKESLQSDIKKLEKQFRQAEKLERGVGGPKAQQFTEVVYKEPPVPKTKSSVKRDHVTYRDPDTGASVNKSSYQKTSHAESSSSSFSKPPRAPPRPARLLSMEDTDSKKSLRPRRRHLSLSADDDDEDFDFKFSSSRSVKTADDDEVKRKFNSAKKLFDERRAHESEVLSDNINRMVNKMRKHSVTDDADSSFRYIRSLRASSLEPQRPRSSSRSHFTYGYSK